MMTERELNKVYREALEEIYRVASISEGVQFYAMLAKKALDHEYVGDTEPRSEF